MRHFILFWCWRSRSPLLVRRMLHAKSIQSQLLLADGEGW
jgi:hypothetical protein